MASGFPLHLTPTGRTRCAISKTARQASALCGQPKLPPAAASQREGLGRLARGGAPDAYRTVDSSSPLLCHH